MLVYLFLITLSNTKDTKIIINTIRENGYKGKVERMEALK